MAKKITELSSVESLLTAAKVLIVQSIEDTDSARLATLTQVANIIKSILALDSTYATVSDVISALSIKGDDLYYDAETSKLYLSADGAAVGEGVTIATDPGLAFDELAVEEVDDVYYLHIKNEGEDVVDPVALPAGGGGGAGVSSVVIQNGMSGRNITVVKGSTCMMAYTWHSYISGEATASTGHAVWQVGGSTVARQPDMAQGSQTFDITQYLSDGSNTVKLTIEDEYGAVKSFSWTVSVAVFEISWNLAAVALHNSDSVLCRVAVTGSGTKSVKFYVDGTLAQTVNNVGNSASYTVPAQEHGAHVITAQMTAVVGGQTVTSDILRHTGIWTETGETDPIIAVYSDEVTAKQYQTSTIQWMAYSPTGETLTVEKYVDGTQISTETVDRTAQIWSYVGKVVGEHTLKLAAGAVEVEIDVTVESLGYDINPVTDGLVMDLDPTGHTNTEQGYDEFGYIDGNGTKHPLTFSSNFDWINGGFKVDGDGVTALLVKRGTYVQFDRSFFDDNARTNGKEIKIVFKASDCRDYDTEILTCYADNIGLKLKANESTLYSSGTSRDILYCEGSKIEMDINIEAANEHRIAAVWLEGVPSRYLAYDTDEWQQTNPQDIKIGSDDCDVWVYRVKMYSTSLSQSEVLQNFVADCSDTEEMVKRYERNDIFTNNALDITKVIARNPNLRVFSITADRLTTSKSDEVPCTVQLQLGADPSKNFIAEGVTMKAQGTSSLEYALSALNLDLDFSSATSWKNDDNEDLTEYAYSDDDLPVTYMNLKLNVASSENANNACLADDYNNYQPNLTKVRTDNPKHRDTCKGYPIAIFFTNSSSASITVGSHTVAAGETILYGNGDLMNSKKNFATFGQTSDYADLLCVEIGNNNNQQCLFKSDDLSTETWDGEPGTSNFEFRYPKKPTAENKASWQALLSWVVSTDRTAATGDNLPQSVVYDGVTYTKDTEAYRAAKFKSEVEDYFNLDSLLYHYLFTERHLMVDNRAKNTFCSYEPDENGVYRWNFNKDYDNDTADGNDNSGGLTFHYGLEDTDQVGASDVFNASGSVLWTNVRDLFPDELVTMYKNRKSAGAWNAERILAKFNEYQSARPEALVAEDMHGKYYLPYSVNAQNRYINMMFGNKTDQRRHFEVYQEQYMDAKYVDLTDTANAVKFRLNAPNNFTGVTPSGNIVGIVPYADTYLNVKYGNAGSARVRATKGETYTLICPQSVALNDLETYLFGASWISHIGQMAALYSKFVDSAAASRLQDLLIGSGITGYNNTGLTAGNGGISPASNPFLEILDLRGLSKLAMSLNLSANKALKEIYLTNSGITGLRIADGAPLETAILGGNLTSLYLHNLPALQTCSGTYDKLESINIEGCPEVDTQTICEAATGLLRGRLTNVSWELDNADLLMRLANCAGYDAEGAATAKFVLTGECNVTDITSAEITAVTTAFPNLTLTYTNLVPAYTVTFKNYDGTVLHTDTVRAGGTARDPVNYGYIPTPVKLPTVDEVYEYGGWNAALENITQDTIFTATFNTYTRTYTVNWWQDYAGGTLLQSSTVTVYSDGEYEGDEPTSEEGFFLGWSTSTRNVQADVDAVAQFCIPVEPAIKPTLSNYDYLYADDNSVIAAYSVNEFAWIVLNNAGKDWFEVGKKIRIVPDTNVYADTAIDLVLADYNHFKVSDTVSTMANTVWVMAGVMNAPHRMNAENTNIDGWKVSEMRTWLNGTIFPTLPKFWQQLIKAVDITTSVGGTSKTNFHTTSDKLWLPSYIEVCYDNTSKAAPYPSEVDENAENVTFPIFTDAYSRAKRRYNDTDTTAQLWWLRSPWAANSNTFAVVTSAGAVGNSDAGGTSISVAFGFCI